ncbi:VanZ family protein [Bacillus timonensis]|nr:VanZ family protein [Bacillus timonensis]
MEKRQIWWLLVIVFCIGIFIATESPAFTGKHTEQILREKIEPPADLPIGEDTISKQGNSDHDSVRILNVILRKSTHFITFGFLAIFVLQALKPTRFYYVYAWLFSSVYGAIDEWHQSFIDERTAQVQDAIIDSAGAFIFLLVFYLGKTFFKNKKMERSSRHLEPR